MDDPTTVSSASNGWTWFDVEPGAPANRSDGEDPSGAGKALALAYVRCFSTRDGEKVLAHLKTLTLERVLGPDAPGQVLRHLEGQRQLVRYIQRQCERGSRGE